MSHSLRVRGAARRAAVVVAALILASCTTVPSLQPTSNSIPIRDIVDRIYCELDSALSPRMAPGAKDINVRNLLRTWSARMDLTFTINTSSGISPGVSFITPLTQIVDKARGTFSQSFTFGIGGGLSGSANRIEKISLQIPLTQLKDQVINGKKSGGTCNPGEWVATLERESGEALTRDLGLREWIDSSLGQLVDQIKGPINFSKELQSFKSDAASQLASFGNGLENRWIEELGTREPQLPQEELLQRLKLEEKKIMALPRQTTLPPADPDQILLVARQVRELLDMINQLSLVPSEKSRQNNEIRRSRVAGALANLNVSIVPDALTEQKNQMIKDIGESLDKISRSLEDAISAQKMAEHTHAQTTLKTITHQVTFVVAANASATPSWSLMRFKGPGGGAGGGGSGSTGASANNGGAGSFASVIRSDTHDLLITLGGADVDTQNVIDQLTAALRAQTPQ